MHFDIKYFKTITQVLFVQISLLSTDLDVCLHMYTLDNELMALFWHWFQYWTMMECNHSPGHLLKYN